ncbi:TcpQ domain-containing protein [Paraburkholderia sp. J8-2]|uniref:TcpQ domain-containing protein n=1 Tax=Paraburkholderia sp. J8-2 TaxID=2805440 RepID=UPI002AB724E5|nr:TcpQ domain-containing protein [Paraburkholderia sp. J8-2]
MSSNDFSTRRDCRTVLAELPMVRLTSRALVACALLVGAGVAHAADQVAMSDSGGWQSLSTGPAVTTETSAPPVAAASNAPQSQVAQAASPALAGKPLTLAGAASTGEAPDSPAPAHAIFTLHGGESIEDQVKAWAAGENWKVEWNTPDDWLVPNDKPYGGNFVDAVTDAMTQIGQNGADVWVDVWLGNRTVVVQKAGASE